SAAREPTIFLAILAPICTVPRLRPESRSIFRRIFRPGPFFMGMAHSQAPPPVSFDTLYKTYRPLVLYWVGVAGVPARDREDLMQAVFIKLHLAQVEGRFHGGDPRFWLCVVTFRLARDWLASWGSRTMTLGRPEVHETADENTRNPEQRARDHEES